MSAATKLLFGCLALAVVGVLGLSAAVALGGFALKRGVESAVGGVEQQREASETLRRLEADHPFQPPAGGEVDTEALGRFLAVTDDAWQQMRPWAKDLRGMREAARAERGAVARLREMAEGARAVGGLARTRLALASALEAHGMSLAEYAWTGIALQRAAEAQRQGGDAADRIPAGNLRLVGEHEGEIPTLDAEDGSGMVLVVATLWGMSELPTWGTLGIDSSTTR